MFSKASRFYRKIWLLFAFGLFIIFAVGCHDQVTLSNPISLSATPANINVVPGQVTTLMLSNYNNIAANGLVFTLSSALSGVSVQNTCSSIPAQGQCVIFIAASNNAPDNTGSLQISGQNITPFSVPVQVGILNNPALFVNKSMLALYQNVSSSDSLILTNIGNVALSGISLNNLPTGVSASGGCTTLTAKNQCTFDFTADNNSIVGTSTTTTLSANGVSPIPLSIQISPANQGPTMATLSINPSSLALTPGANQTVSLTNIGPASLDSGLIINANSFTNGDIAIIPDMNCTDLAANSSCNITISADANSPNYSATPINFSATNTNNFVSVLTTVGPVGFYLMSPSPVYIELEKALNVVIGNTGASTQNVHLLNLPSGVTPVNVCLSLPNNGSCNFTLVAATNATLGTSNFIVTDGASSLSIPLTVTSATLQATQLGNTVYVPTTGESQPITVTNTNANITIQNVSINGLPTGVTATSCPSIAPLQSCTITLSTSNTSVSTNPTSFTIQGTDTNVLTGQVFIEQPNLSLSPNPLTFTGPGTITVTVTNNSHFDIDNVTPSSTGTTNTTISNNTCNLLAPIGSGTANSCTFDLTTTANATATTNANLSVSGTLTGSPDLSTTAPMSLATPPVQINNDQDIIIDNVSGDQYSIPIGVNAGGFNLQNPNLTLDLGSNNANVSHTTTCSSSMIIAGSTCNLTVTNTADLDTTVDGTLTVSGSNLPQISKPVNVVGGLASNIILFNSPNASTYYTSQTNGPSYDVILLQNLGQSTIPNGDSTFTFNTIQLIGDTSLNIISRDISATDPYYGNNKECATSASGNYIVNSLAPGDSCILLVHSDQNFIGIKTASLNINASSNPNIGVISKTFTLTSNGYLYAASATNALKWNGTAWSNVGTTTLLTTFSLSTDAAGNLYAGGSFSSPGNRIAKWNGSVWSALGTGVNGGVFALTPDNQGNLYAGGTMTSPGSGIVKWNGSAWSALGTGIEDGGIINATSIDASGNVYAGGSFNYMDGSISNSIAEWESSNNSWTTLGMGTTSGSGYGNVNALVINNNGNLFAGGQFSSVGGNAANNVAEWDINSGTWLALGSGINGSVNAMTIGSNGNIYAGGSFSSTGNNIAMWNGIAWSSLSSGTNGSLNALIADNSGNIYAYGNFTTAGGINANHIAVWNNDNNTWSPLGPGINYSSSLSYLAIGSLLSITPGS